MIITLVMSLKKILIQLRKDQTRKMRIKTLNVLDDNKYQIGNDCQVATNEFSVRVYGATLGFSFVLAYLLHPMFWIVEMICALVGLCQVFWLLRFSVVVVFTATKTTEFEYLLTQFLSCILKLKIQVESS